VGIDLARRAPARPDALTPTLAPRVARSLARFEGAKNFNQPLDKWVVNNVNSGNTCKDFCYKAGFNPTSRIPSFPGTCGDPGCGGFYLASNGITVKCPGVAVGRTFYLNGVTYTKRDRDGLRSIIKGAYLIDSRNDPINQQLETSCTTGVTDMNGLFDDEAYFGWDYFASVSKLNPAINSWDTGLVTRMDRMWVLTAPAWVVGDVRPPALSRSRSLRASFARSLALQVQEFVFQSGDQRMGHEQGGLHEQHVGFDLDSPCARPPRRAHAHARSARRSLGRQVRIRQELQPGHQWVEHEFGDDHGIHVGTDLARRAPARPDALTPTLAPRVARSLARFEMAYDFDQDLNDWDTSSVTTMAAMWVLTSPAVRSPAPTRSRPRSLRASLDRSPGSGTPRTSIRPSIAGTRAR